MHKYEALQVQNSLSQIPSGPNLPVPPIIIFDSAFSPYLKQQMPKLPIPNSRNYMQQHINPNRLHHNILTINNLETN
jgi:hypothetical protein